MLTTIEAEIDENGKVTFLEPLKIAGKSRAIITLLDDQKTLRKDEPSSAKPPNKADENARQLEWLKANRDQSAGKYVALDGELLVAHADTLAEIREQTKDRKNLFIVKVFAEETSVSAGV